MVLLAIGDICGETGLRCFEKHIRSYKKTNGVDICVVNGENADVLGIRPEQAERLFNAGADVVTLGNHTWGRMQIASELDNNPRLIRPLNFSPNVPGNGSCVIRLNSGHTLCVVNLVGRCNCIWNADSPFTIVNNFLNKELYDLYCIDFHAEATSEKAALAWMLDGKVSAVFGTHTHVQTSDERILPGGTGFITDIGMTGAINSILGIKPQQSISHFLGNTPVRYETAPGPSKMEGILFDIDESTGHCKRLQRLQLANN